MERGRGVSFSFLGHAVIVIGLAAIPTATAGESEKIDLDAAFRCLNAGLTWSFLPHSEEQPQWRVVLVGTKAATASTKGPITVGQISFAPAADAKLIVDCARLAGLFKATPEQWNAFVERLTSGAETKTLQVFVLEVPRPNDKLPEVPFVGKPMKSPKVFVDEIPKLKGELPEVPKFGAPLTVDQIRKLLLRQ